MPQHVKNKILCAIWFVYFSCIADEIHILKLFKFTRWQEIINTDFESEVEDDMLSIFRKGEVETYPFIWISLDVWTF